jgi:hypothetical protein
LSDATTFTIVSCLSITDFSGMQSRPLPTQAADEI